MGPSTIQAMWSEFVGFLRQRGGRITPTRRIVFERALSHGDHFRVDELVHALATGTERVSRGSVYRTLALMVEFGALRQIRDGDAHYHYEAVSASGPNHEHMVCEACGTFLEFDSSALARAIDEACEQQGFMFRTRRVTVMGRCRDCRAEAKDLTHD